jgi:hypothetical protein
MASSVATKPLQASSDHASDLTIPVYWSLRPVHGPDTEALAAADARYEGLAMEFLKEYGAAPVLFVRSPGRFSTLHLEIINRL